MILHRRPPFGVKCNVETSIRTLSTTLRQKKAQLLYYGWFLSNYDVEPVYPISVLSVWGRVGIWHLSPSV